MLDNVRGVSSRLGHRLALWLAPDLEHSQVLYKRLLERCLGADTTWLDLGCGRKLFPEWMDRSDMKAQELVARCHSVTGVDADLGGLRRHQVIRRRVRADISALPFGPDTFDLVTANMVMEHVPDPRRVVAEVSRVLRRGGVFLVHTPNLLNFKTRILTILPTTTKVWLAGLLEQREEEDVFPTFYRANTPRRIRALADASSLRLAELQLFESVPEMASLGPLVLVELLLVRICRPATLARYRSQIFAILRKEERSFAEAACQS